VKYEAFPVKGPYPKWIRLALAETEIIWRLLAKSRARRYIE
jgi:hypothetical protein